MLTNLRRIVRKLRSLFSVAVPHLKEAPPSAAKGEGAPLNLREWVAQTYLQGEGVEIGALHNPLKLPSKARVLYLDRMSVPQLREQYPELGALNLVEVDIIEDGEKLSTLKTDSQDFLIANHFLEHCGDPLGTLKNFLRVVRSNGILYLAVPDKRYTFDRDRPVTSLAHLFDDHQYGPERSRRQHFEEWVRLVNKCEKLDEVEARVKHFMDMNYSIHYHVWTQTEFLEFLHAVKRMLSFEVEVFLKHQHEMIMILRKASAGSQPSETMAA